jgi:hypothetical protein
MAGRRPSLTGAVEAMMRHHLSVSTGQRQLLTAYR